MKNQNKQQIFKFLKADKTNAKALQNYLMYIYICACVYVYCDYIQKHSHLNPQANGLFISLLPSSHFACCSSYFFQTYDDQDEMNESLVFPLNDIHKNKNIIW